MVKNYILAGGFAVICGSAMVSAQATPQQPPQTTPPAGMQASANTTVEGCVYEEKNIPGRSPNVAEKAGMMEDYILVTSASTSATGAATGAVGTSGAATASAKMFKLEHADDEKLKALVGKRVRVVGKADVEKGDTRAPGATPQADRSAGHDKIELPEFEVSTISETTGTCPATPEIRK